MMFLPATGLTILTIAHFLTPALSAFNASICGISKSCAMQPANCRGADGNVDKCDFVFAHAKSLSTSDRGLVVEMDLVGRVNNPNELHYISFGFSNDDLMGDEPVIACIFQQDGRAVPHQSRNNGQNNYPLNEDKITQLQMIESSVTNGVSHCRISQDFSLKIDSGFQADPIKPQFLLGALGPAESNNALSFHDNKKVIAQNIRLVGDAETVKSTLTPSFSLGLSTSTIQLFVRLHGLFMIVAWLACVSLAIFSARYLRNTFDAQFGGIKLWFHVHRTLNVIAILLIIASTVFIAMANNLRWTGPWFTKNADTNFSIGSIHSLFGALSVLVAVIQPFNSLLRCAPDHPKRSIFNIVHRVIGLFGLICALGAIFIAVYIFKRHFNSGPDIAKGTLTAAVLTALALIGVAEALASCGIRQRVASIELSARTNGKHHRSDSDAFSYRTSASGITRSQKMTNSVIFGLFAAVVLVCTIVLALLIE